MASLWKHPNSPSYMACFTAYLGASRRQWKLTTATADRKLARRIADELEDAASGQRSKEQIDGFLQTITDRRARRAAHQAFDAVMRKTTGKGLGAQTVRGYVESWLGRIRNEVAAGTFARYKLATDGLVQSLGGKADQEMALVTRTDIARFRDSEADRVAPATANLALKITRLLFNAAEADGVVLRNEARHVKRVKDRANRARRRAFTFAEIQRILTKCDEEWRSLVVFGLYTGARLGDLAMLTWQNLDLEKCEVRFLTRKTGRQMIIPLVRPLREHIESLPAGDDPKQPVHPRARAIVEREGRAGTLSRQFGEILADAGLVLARTHRADEENPNGRAARRAVSEVSFHSLRHSMVSLMKAAGVSAAVAMDLAGHESPEMNAHYTHLDEATKLAALNKLPDITKPAKTSRKK
jgi:integrase